jgi:ribosomal-protein-alanine N-acetyltransferase
VTVLTARAMRWWDIEHVMTLEQDIFGDESWSQTMFWSELAESGTRWYRVVVDGDDVVGYAGLCAYPPHEAYVQTIAVASSHRGRGIGAQLLMSLLDEAVRRGCRHIDLEVRADNPVAIGLYERHGFTATGRRRAYYQPSGTDAIVMRKELS